MANEYIINSKLEEVIIKFKAAKLVKHEDEEHFKEFQRLQDILACFFYELSQNLMKAYNFKLLDYDDAMQEGVLIALQKVDRFDPTYIGKNGKKSKAFNYMTTCILNHFRQLHRGVKVHRELQARYFSHLLDKLDNIIREVSLNGFYKATYKDGNNN